MDFAQKAELSQVELRLFRSFASIPFAAVRTASSETVLSILLVNFVGEWLSKDLLWLQEHATYKYK